MPNMPAVEGMRFVTGDNGRLEVEFEDGSVARVTPDSSIRLSSSAAMPMAAPLPKSMPSPVSPITS